MCLTNANVIKMPELVASAMGNVVSTPNSRPMGKTGIVKQPSAIINADKVTVIQGPSELWYLTNFKQFKGRRAPTRSRAMATTAMNT